MSEEVLSLECKISSMAEVKKAHPDCSGILDSDYNDEYELFEEIFEDLTQVWVNWADVYPTIDWVHKDGYICYVADFIEAAEERGITLEFRYDEVVAL